MLLGEIGAKGQRELHLARHDALHGHAEHAHRRLPRKAGAHSMLEIRITRLERRAHESVGGIIGLFLE